MTRFEGCPADVRGDATVGEVEQGVLGFNGFLGADVEGRASDAVGAEGVGEGDLVNEAAAAGIDEEEVGLGEGEAVVVDQKMGGGGERGVEGDEVGVAEDLVDREPVEGEVRDGLAWTRNQEL